MVTRIEVRNPADISVSNAGWKVGNIITVSFTNAHQDLHIEMTDDNYEDLKRAIISE